jgi:hypothetical protein
MYSAPAGNAVNFHFQVSPYVAPSGSHVNFTFGGGGGSGLPFRQFTVIVIA